MNMMVQGGDNVPLNTPVEVVPNTIKRKVDCCASRQMQKTSRENGYLVCAARKLPATRLLVMLGRATELLLSSLNPMKPFGPTKAAGGSPPLVSFLIPALPKIFQKKRAASEC